MSPDDLTSDAETYIENIDRHLKEWLYFREELNNRLQRYRHDHTTENEVDLKSSIAFYEKYGMSTASDIRKIRPKRTYESYDMFTLNLQGDWRAFEFDQFFHSIDYLNKVFVLREKLLSDTPEMRLRQGMTRDEIYRHARLYYYLTPREELQVARVEMSSPGFIIFRGLPNLIREFKKFIEDTISLKVAIKIVNTYDKIRYDRPVKQLERELKLKQLEGKIQLELRKQEIQELKDAQEYLKQIGKLGDTVEQLQRKGLAVGSLVEDQIIHSISKLHRLGYESQKILPASDLAENQ